MSFGAASRACAGRLTGGRIEDSLHITSRGGGSLLRRAALLAAADIGAVALPADTRSQAQREVHGEVPGALLVERNVLEWRFDPASAYRLPQVTGYEIRVIIMCAEGYSSVLAAVSLQDLGLVHATDMVGGFGAWARAGLPVIGGRQAAA